ncbi:hypothetical protein [Sphaerisporangium rubeum]
MAADLGMPGQTIYVWLRQERIDAGLEPDLSSADHVELVAARRRIAQLEVELAVTRRAMELVKEAPAATSHTSTHRRHRPYAPDHSRDQSSRMIGPPKADACSRLNEGSAIQQIGLLPPALW